MATIETSTLNQYTGTNSLGTPTVIVAEDMATACTVYQEQEDSDPVIMQCTKQNIKCVMPTVYVSFKAFAAEEAGDGTAFAGGCRVAPVAYTVKAGTQQIFTAVAPEGWEFVKWEIVGYEDAIDEEEATKAVAMLTIPSASDPIKIKAIFKTTVD